MNSSMKKYLTITFSIMLLSLSACGSDSPHKSISTVGLMSGEEFSLDISNYHNSGDFDINGFRFRIIKKMDFNEESFTSQNPDIEIDYYDGNITFFKQLESGQYDAFSLIGMGKQLYLLINNAGRLHSTYETHFLLPHHLIRDERIKHKITPEILPGMYYELYNDESIVDLFFQFYEKTGWYELTRDEDGIVLDGYKVEPTNSVSAEYLNSVEFPIIISFVEVEEQQCFTIRY